MSELVTDQGRLAKKWREARGLSRAALGEMIGYSASQIECFEEGRQRNSGKSVNPAKFMRFKLACAAVAANVIFDWGAVTVKLG